MSAILLRAMVGLAALAVSANSADCNGAAPPGPRNTHPIDDAAPVFVRSVANGKLYSVGQGDDKRDLLHLYGSPYENGMAMGMLLGPKVVSFFNEVYHCEPPPQATSVSFLSSAPGGSESPRVCLWF